MRDFEMKMMPALSQSVRNWRPLEHDKIDVDRWNWQNYPILNIPAYSSKNR